MFLFVILWDWNCFENKIIRIKNWISVWGYKSLFFACVFGTSENWLPVTPHTTLLLLGFPNTLFSYVRFLFFFFYLLNLECYRLFNTYAFNNFISFEYLLCLHYAFQILISILFFLFSEIRSCKRDFITLQTHNIDIPIIRDFLWFLLTRGFIFMCLT